MPRPPLPAALTFSWPRRLSAPLLLGSFYLLPWLSINGEPAVLFDLAGRHAYLLGIELAADELPALLALAVSGLALLYLLTNLGGRLWCGLLCPQSILGSLYQQLMQLGRHGGNLLWALLAIWTGISFVGYFTPVRQLLPPDAAGWNHWTVFWAVFYAAATWANIRFLRTRLCTELCPFARLQPWITDQHTPHVRYQLRRGEPRGARAPGLPGIHARGRALLNPTTAQDYVFRAANPAIAGSWPRFAPDRLGDCLDCAQCQQQCPLKLDIRNGVDGNCLDCGLCISVCDRQLAAHGLPGGLIRRQSQADAEEQPARFMRPRTVVALVIALGSALSSWLLLH